MSDNVFKQTIPVLKTARLTLRPISLNDLEAMFNYASSENVARFVTWEPHKSFDDTKEFIELILNGYKQGKHLLWGIEYEQKLIGTIDFVSINDLHKFAEIGYVLSEEYWNQGITTEAAKKLIDYGFNELKLARIQARCFEENIGSQKVMEKSGMLYEGLLRKSMFVKGNHQNVKMYAIINNDYFTKIEPC
ncbi:GNAT family N-acetyltransferase [Lysinibacillus xylanilyticus]|uniref:GNAT family N-acetyltransferase n=1 Tax=Lysinibacillus xylanilyticus TaxID=582475 RepID=UPI003CFC73C5